MTLSLRQEQNGNYTYPESPVYPGNAEGTF
jgi:hypothetical protein